MRKLLLICSVIGSLFISIMSFADVVPPSDVIPLVNNSTVKNLFYGAPKIPDYFKIQGSGYVNLANLDVVAEQNNTLYLMARDEKLGFYGVANIVYDTTNRSKILQIINSNLTSLKVSSPDGYTLIVSESD